MCRLRVADGGLLVDAEDDGEVERVGAVSEGLFELAVDTESFQRGCLAAERGEDADTADGAVLQRGLLVDQQVRVGGVGPAPSPMLQPGGGGLQHELVQGPGAAVDNEPAVADVEVVELEAADRVGPGGVDGREGEDQLVWRAGRRGDGGADVLGFQGLDDAVLQLADPDAAGRVLEDRAVLFGPREQRPRSPVSSGELKVPRWAPEGGCPGSRVLPLGFVVNPRVWPH
ncbi:hypothetical protein [Streptomyces mirabilis]|uniref:hypothetical protein n=1 Tax=Streptomyces mirabilis TaxID=68239 RepID=UPI003317523A